MNTTITDLLAILEPTVVGLLLARIVSYSQKTPSNYYYGVVACLLWIHLGLQRPTESLPPHDDTVNWLIPGGLLVITHVWISIRRFHDKMWGSPQRYTRVVTSVAV